MLSKLTSWSQQYSSHQRKRTATNLGHDLGELSLLVGRKALHRLCDCPRLVHPGPISHLRISGALLRKAALLCAVSVRRLLLLLRGVSCGVGRGALRPSLACILSIGAITTTLSHSMTWVSD